MLARLPSTGAVLAVAFFLVVVLVRTTQPLLDGDVWWHLRAGETVLRELRVPTTDTWTIAGAGMPWISQDWLSNIGLASLVGLGGRWGYTLASLAFGMIVVVAFGLLWDAIRRRHPASSAVGRVLCLGAGLVVAAPVLGVRVQTIDLLMVAATVWLLWGYIADRRAGWLVGLPVLTVAWANLHAGWPLLFAIGGAVVVGELIDRAAARCIGPHPPLRWVDLANLAIALVACIPALLLNPSGVRLLVYPFTTSAIEAHRDFLFEWSSPDVSTFPGQALLVFLALVVLPMLAAGTRHLRSAEMLWLGGLSVLSLSAIRFVIAIGPIGAAVAAVVIASALSSGSGRWAAAGRLIRVFDRPPRTARLGVINLVMATVLGVIGIGTATARVAPAQQDAAIQEAMPTRAVAWLRDARPTSRIFNVYAWGGFIGRELNGSIVYIDGRSDIYGDGPIREYAEAISLQRDPFAILARERVDAVLFWSDTAFSAALDDHSSWQRVYDDGQAAIWFRTEGE